MEPTLYIIMRSDLQDMNPGKGMAQAAHAQADFDSYIFMMVGNDNNTPVDLSGKKAVLIDYAEWCGVRNFGRTIVLEGTQDQIADIAAQGKHSGITVDPTYPWKNYYGELYVTEEVTCGWAFISYGNTEDLELTAKLSLHR